MPEEFPSEYEFIIRGHLEPRRMQSFEGLEITCLGDGTTRLAGMIEDQPMLYGIITRFRDLGLGLVSVKIIGTAPKNTP